MDRQQELQQNIEWLREKLPKDEPELPYSLYPTVLLERAEETATEHRAFSFGGGKQKRFWGKWAAVACSLLLCFGMGTAALLNPAHSKEAAPQLAAYSLADENKSMASRSVLPAEAKAVAEEAEVEEYSFQVSDYAADWAALTAIYPELSDKDFYVLVENGERYTVLCVSQGEESRFAVIQAGETQVYEDGEQLVVCDTASGRELRLQTMTLEPLEP